MKIKFYSANFFHLQHSNIRLYLKKKMYHFILINRELVVRLLFNSVTLITIKRFHI